jgi:hypothetical protein
MELEGSLPHSQVPTTCLYPEPAQSSPYSHIFCVDICFINLRKMSGFKFKGNSSTRDIVLRLFTDILNKTEDIATIIDTSSWNNKIIDEQILLRITVLSKCAM